MQATWATIAVPTLPVSAVRELTLLFVNETGFNHQLGLQIKFYDITVLYIP